MKRLLVTLLASFAFLTQLASAQTADTPQPAAPAQATATAQTPAATAESHPAPAPSGTANRLFFPEGWIYGYVQFDIAPPHNEPDPNLCAANAGQYGGVNSQCTAFARYLLGGNVVIHPFGRTFLRFLKFEATPTFAMGKNIPQTLYTWSMQPIGMERSWAAAIDLPKRFDIRVTQHYLWWRGSANLGPAYLGPNGPWGRSTTIGVRKSFGTYRDYYGPQPIK